MRQCGPVEHTARRRRRAHEPLIASCAALLVATTSVFAGLLAAPAALAEVAPAVLPAECAATAQTVTCTYRYTGATQTFTPPSGATSVMVTVSGAGGGAGATPGSPLGAGGAGGLGATVTGTLSKLGTTSLTLYVGGAGLDARYNQVAATGTGGFGYGPGGSGGHRYFDGGDHTFVDGGGGGGGSAILAGDTPLVVAGAGGGGGGGSAGVGANNNGGRGGGSSGRGSDATDFNGGPGAPGGAAGASGSTSGESGGDPSGYSGVGGGGGGGGGLPGGAGGAGGEQFRVGGGFAGAGGGGGTNLVPTGGNATDGTHQGDGEVTITYSTAPTTPPVPSRMTGGGVVRGTGQTTTFSLNASTTGRASTGTCSVLVTPGNVLQCQSVTSYTRTGNQVTFTGRARLSTGQTTDYTATALDAANPNGAGKDVFTITSGSRQYGGTLTTGNITITP